MNDETIYGEPTSPTLDAALTELTLVRLRSLPDLDAAAYLTCRLRALEDQYKRSFVETGIICIEVQERALWRLLCDPVGVRYHSFEQWVCSSAPHSRRHCFSAMAAVKELREIPLGELSQIPQCNIALLQSMSSGVRSQPEVIAAAQALPEKEFRAKVQADFPGQHLEGKRRMVLNFSAGDFELVCNELDDVGAKLGISDREGELLALLIDRKMEREQA